MRKVTERKTEERRKEGARGKGGRKEKRIQNCLLKESIVHWKRERREACVGRSAGSCGLTWTRTAAELTRAAEGQESSTSPPGVTS